MSTKQTPVLSFIANRSTPPEKEPTTTKKRKSFFQSPMHEVILTISGGSWLLLMVGPAKTIIEMSKSSIHRLPKFLVVSRCFSVNCYLGMHVNILVFNIGFLFRNLHIVCQIFSGARPLWPLCTSRHCLQHEIITVGDFDVPSPLCLMCKKK